MNYGLYLAAGGLLTTLHRQSVTANNLANVNTVAFKPDSVFTRVRLPERLESGAGGGDPQLMLEKLGGGLFVQPTYTSFTQGALTPSDNPLDAAIEGEGFFVVRHGIGPQLSNLRLTRDGRFARNEAGELVMASSGLPVLDINSQPIVLANDAPVTVQSDGTISQHGDNVAQLQLVKVPDPRRLTKAGDNLYRTDTRMLARLEPAPGRIAQGFVEASAANPITGLTEMMTISRAAEFNMKMIQYADNIIGQAVNTLGRVA